MNQHHTRNMFVQLALVLGAAVAIAPTASAMPAKAMTAKTPCQLITPKMISRTLGMRVPAARATPEGTVLFCIYGPPSFVRKDVLVRFEVGMSKAKFAAERNRLNAYQPTKTFRGLGLPAYSAVGMSGGSVVNTLVVLKGHTDLEVVAPAGLTKVATLIKLVLPKL